MEADARNGGRLLLGTERRHETPPKRRQISRTLESIDHRALLAVFHAKCELCMPIHIPRKANICIVLCAERRAERISFL